MPFTTRELFARLIKCEAGGEGENGMKAVASTVMNRVNVPFGEYFRVGQGDLRKIITQPGQYTCFKSVIGSQVNPQTVWASNPEEIHYEIADWALSGHSFSGIGESLWYYNPYNPQCATFFPPNRSGVIINRINDHCFYNPTNLYAKT